jgi:hypothetical protein
METQIDVQNGPDSGSGVRAHSDTLTALEGGLKRINAMNNATHKSNEQNFFRCGGCCKKYKTKSGLTKHWNSKRNDCTDCCGHEMVSGGILDNIKSNNPKMDFLLRAQEAARNVAQELSDIRPDKVTVKRLANYPIGNFQNILRKADVKVIKEFVETTRFDSSNSSKKVQAVEELKRRGG